MRTALLLLLATAAPAQTVTALAGERLPSWLKHSGEFRTRVEGRTGFSYQPDNNDAYVLVRNRLNVEIAPTKWLDFFAQGQDSRAPGVDAGRPLATFKDPFDLRQAYVRLGKPTGLVRLTVGRQLLSYGAQRLIGPLDWTNTSRSWDAVKLEIGTADAKVDHFASSVVVIDPAHPDHHRDGFNIHGAYGAFKRVIPRATVEPYLLWKTGRVSIWTAGMRVVGTAPHNFDYQAEFAHQNSAAAGYAILGYATGKRNWAPHFSAEYSHASRRFDQLLPTNHLFYGITDPTGWQNMNMARAGVDLKPRKQLQLNADYRELWLASASDPLYAVNGTAAVKPRAGNTARRIGGEIDFSGSWAISPQWKLGAGVGHLAAGDVLKENTKGSGQTFPYLFAQYSY
jgi:hypothetical protein